MNRGLEIRRAAAGDALALAQLAAASFDDPWSAAQFADELAAPAARVYLAQRGSEPAGYLAARRAADVLEILSLAVAPASRRSGVGLALYTTAERAEAGLAAVQLEMRESNAAARAFYQRLGFRSRGRRARYYANGEAAILMDRPLV